MSNFPTSFEKLTKHFFATAAKLMRLRSYLRLTSARFTAIGRWRERG